MATFLILNSLSPALPIHTTAYARATFKPLHVQTIRFAGDGKPRRSLSVITRAAPSTTTYVVAFLIPLSMLIGTIITSLRISDKLDRDYLEELAINQAIRDADEEGDDDDGISLEDEVNQRALQGTKTRNRPKREA
ncbi:uncharacterized protein LOC126680673 [Mercurialis annua]|uniref:uncharacterized protein LOC126680673 n=1 Tax=Mercurialis annua TaxID=3986 RepID=UPI00215F2CA8|nr:uncharacterized protein LOC126680673 [Mercurialis annua]